MAKLQPTAPIPSDTKYSRTISKNDVPILITSADTTIDHEKCCEILCSGKKQCFKQNMQRFAY
jgi:hypothetical protein